MWGHRACKKYMRCFLNFVANLNYFCIAVAFLGKKPKKECYENKALSDVKLAGVWHLMKSYYHLNSKKMWYKARENQ